MVRSNLAGLVAPDTRLAEATFVRAAPRPRVPKPEAGKYNNESGFIRTICDGNSHMNIVGFLFCVLRKDIEISIFGERSSIKELVLREFQTAPAVFMNEWIVGKWVLGVLVKRFEVRMGWGGVEVEITFLAIFAMIAFWAGESEETFLQDCILSVP